MVMAKFYSDYIGVMVVTLSKNSLSKINSPTPMLNKL